MNKLSQLITGGLSIALSIWFIIFLGLADGSDIDWFIILAGLFFLIIGLFMIFNDKEDEIEEIKQSKD